ncbi:hypothetical protein Vafri_10537 [Volvox africanus]|uniref:Uncharacterized protein n=1 Tax=Volvox africanus TaxID=51714 RepID=A0A8J4BAP6_9CHLO|nr:hypothetical protein Vafri_10537 [Volvox africanus]
MYITISASAMSRQDVAARSISWWIALGLTCAVLHHVRGAGAAPLKMSPPPSTSNISSSPLQAGARTPPSSVRKPPPIPRPTPRSSPPKLLQPKSPVPKSSTSKLPPPSRSPPPKSPPPSPLRMPPPSPQPKSLPPAPALPSPSSASLSDSCSFCAKVTIVEPKVLKMIPAICTDMATQVMYDIKELYSPPSSNVRNIGSSRISCAPDSRQVTICTSVRATALRTVAQAALDERVWGWTQVARFYIDDCKPFILISSEITSPDGCLTSDQSDAYSCDM